MSRFLIVSLGAYVVCLPAFGASAVLAPDVAGGKSILPADVFFVLTTCALAVAGRSRLLPLRPDILALAGAVVGWMAIAGLRANGDEAVLELWRTGYSMAVLIVLAHARLTDDERARTLDAWLVPVIVLAALSVLSYIGVVILDVPQNALARGGSQNLGVGVVRASGSMHPTTFAIYLTLGLAVAVHRIAARAWWSRRWGVAVILLLAGTCALTFSRAVAGMVVMMAILAHEPDRLVWLWRVRRGVSALAVIVVAVVVMTTLWPIVPLDRRDDSVEVVATDSTANLYPLLHRAAVRMLLTDPLFGVGPGEFGANFCSYTSEAERNRARPPARCIEWDPHSVWLGAAAEGGLLLAMAWIALYGGVLRLLVRSAGGMSLPHVGAAALVGLMLDGLHVDFTHVKFVWAFLGLALGAAATAERA